MPRKPPPECRVTVRMSDGRLLASGTTGVMAFSDEVPAEERQAICDRMLGSFIRGPWAEAERARAARRVAAGDRGNARGHRQPRAPGLERQRTSPP